MSMLPKKNQSGPKSALGWPKWLFVRSNHRNDASSHCLLQKLCKLQWKRQDQKVNDTPKPCLKRGLTIFYLLFILSFIESEVPAQGPGDILKLDSTPKTDTDGKDAKWFVDMFWFWVKILIFICIDVDFIGSLCGFFVLGYESYIFNFNLILNK